MCQAEETWKGNKMTVSVSVKSWHILEREFKPALWAWSAPKGIRKCWFPAGQVSATLFRIGILPKGKRLLQGCRRSSESSGWAWKHPPYTHRKHVFWCSIHSHSPPPAPSLSFIWHSHLQPQAHLTHIKTKSCPDWVQFQQLVGLCAWRYLNFLSVWVLPEIFLGFFLDL